jgi:nitrite reductase/ring-hydroxylating ferredoxin subunit
MAEPGLIRIGDATQLADGGSGLKFDVAVGGRSATAFVVRWRGSVIGYLNQCAHVAMELDWIAGRFFDRDATVLMCATHGALYDPVSGACIGGPCQGRGGLRRIEVFERDGGLWWRPDAVVSAPPGPE